MKTKMKTIKHLLLILFFSFLSCQKTSKKQVEKNQKNTKMQLTDQAKKVRNYVKKNIVIAHRGSKYWTPEETAPAYLWARDIGADYLEMDLQLTKDNQLVAFHDDNLKRTSNVEKIFPERSNASIHDFTLQELRKLDVGSWFNKKNPKRAKEEFKNLKIVTLKDIIKIAEGNRLIYNEKTKKFDYIKDPNDTGNRPGIYVETKHPKSNIEKFLAKELTSLGWNINTNPKKITVQKDKVAIANTNARLILQSFSPKSIIQLDKYLPNIPKCFLLWKPDMKGDLKENYKNAIAFAIKNNAEIIGPSIAGKPNNYDELTDDWMIDLIHKNGLLIHPYTFDTTEQLEKYAKKVDGVFTNRADLALKFYNRLHKK